MEIEAGRPAARNSHSLCKFEPAIRARIRSAVACSYWGIEALQILEMINLDRHRATSSAPRTQHLDEVHHERLEICRPISSRRSHPISRPKAHPPRAGLRSPGEPATALDDRKFDPEPEPDHGAAKPDGPSA